jgi:ATP synthase protein I
MADHDSEREREKDQKLDKDLEDARLKARLDKLSEALDAQDDASRPGQQPGSLGDGSVGSAMNLGFRVMTEFVAAVVVGALIGWQIDTWAGMTVPIFLLLFLALGTVAGFMNVYRIATKPTGGRQGVERPKDR